MPKFSVIVPVYNTEKYLRKCIDSILNQSYDDYEIIIVNDGSTDSSKKIINEYCKTFPSKIKGVHKKNGGLSDARNKGVKKACGDYLLFVDSDDYIEKNLLKTLSKKLKDEPDIIRFQIKEVHEDKVCMYRELPFETVKGDVAFKKIVNYHYVENAWCYAYRTKFYKENKFEYAFGKYHEDFGLTPLIIMKASKVKSIGYVGYNYVIRNDSIMTSTDYNKTKIKAEDFLYHYNNLINALDHDELKNKDVYKSFLANSLILKSLELDKKDYKKYITELKKIKVFDNILDDTYQRKIKKIMLKISPKLYYKVVK